MSTPYFRGEQAPLDNKNSGNEDQGKFKPYAVKIDFDGAEFYCRLTVLRRDFHFRALTSRELRDQVRRTFPDVPVTYELSRSARLASDPSTILRG